MPYEYEGWVDGEFASVRDLVNRYVDYYGNPPGRVVATEFELVAPVRPGLRLVGYIDLVVVIDGALWPVEIKSAGQLGKRMEYLDVDGQITCYLAGLQAMGLDVPGVIFDGVNTYPYKDRSKVEPEKLFKRQEVTRSKFLLDAFWRDIDIIASDIERAKERGTYPRHLGSGCSRCDFQGPCFAELEGDEVKKAAFVRTDYGKREGR